MILFFIFGVLSYRVFPVTSVNYIQNKIEIFFDERPSIINQPKT
jgi:hypothetical protein